MSVGGKLEGTPAALRARVRAGLGFRAHSGWAAMVAVAEHLTLNSEQARAILPDVVERRRIELAAPGIPVQPYHAAAELDLTQAGELIDNCIEQAQRLAREALRKGTGALREKGYEVVGCGILTASGRLSQTLAGILASHAQIHAAEGDLFRAAIAHAAEHCGLVVVKVKERDLYNRAAAELGLSEHRLQDGLTELGRGLGPPWRQDEKYAASVACLALNAAIRSSAAGEPVA